MMKHCYRDSGDARYAIKYLRKDVVGDPQALLQGIADLNLETRYLSYLAATPHPNVIKLRAIASGERFSPSYFIVIDRLYDTLETRLEKWMDKVKALDTSSPGNRLKSLLGPSNRRLSGGKDYDLRGQRSMLLDDQQRAVCDLSSAIAHLHKHNIMHRDLKPTNLGFDIRGDIKVGTKTMC
jgi:serine/threonine protein kinase